ncbi:transcriptional regulator, ArsR family [Stigmatella aurantiaca DW4/3-1]|nr:transcriptional regulator, ArsR family [Stigmatella aurantiaca DW4/3-1]
MLHTLSQHERSVGELAAPFRMSLAAASKHIKVLERAGLVRRNVQGRTHMCRLAPEPLSAVQEWLRFYERFWTDRLDALDALLQTEPPPPVRKKGSPR